MWWFSRSKTKESQPENDEAGSPETARPDSTAARLFDLQQTAGNRAIQRALGKSFPRAAPNPDESSWEVSPSAAEDVESFNPASRTSGRDGYFESGKYAPKANEHQSGHAPSPAIQLRAIDSGRTAGQFGDGFTEAAFTEATSGASSEVPFRSKMEAAFAEDFGGVRAHLGQRESLVSIGAQAATSGEDVAFASKDPDEVTVAHELTHVVQQRRYGGQTLQGKPGVSRPSDAAEREADQISHTAAAGAHVRAQAEPSASISLQPTPETAKGSTQYWPGLEPKPGPPPTHVFEDPTAWTPTGAPKAMDIYVKLAPGNRKAAFDLSYPKGSVGKVLKALSPADATGAYRDPVRELLRWVEEAETRLASGKTDEQMAEAEAKFIQANAEAEAKKKAASPSPAQIEQARQEKLKQTSYKPADKSRWEKLSDAKKQEWTAAGEAAIEKLVNYAAKARPELKLDKSHMKLAFHDIDKVNFGSLAMGGIDGGKIFAQVGFEFVEAVKANPAYALSTIVHEVWGHPEFGDPYFGHPKNYQRALFEKAAPKIPGYVSDPATEQGSYGYHESEIYSLLRELPYWSPVAAEHKKLEHLNYDPKKGIVTQINEIKREWEPGLFLALMHGLYKRISLDPRIEKSALTAFEGIITSMFSKDDAAKILK